MTGDFWRQLAQLVAESEIVIDRPQGSAHPRYPDFVCPLDYGGGLHSGFGKRDVEVKVLLGCTEAEIEQVRAVLSRSPNMSCLVLRPTAENG